jgi:hypothetical protein
MTWSSVLQVQGTDPLGGALFLGGTGRASLAGSNFSANRVVVRFLDPSTAVYVERLQRCVRRRFRGGPVAAAYTLKVASHLLKAAGSNRTML